MEQARRESFAKALREAGGERARLFAEVVVGTGDPEGPMCWGHLVDSFETTFAADDERIALLPALLAAGDLGALLLYLDVNRARPAVLTAIAKGAAQLPFLIQCAFASLPDGKRYLGETRGLHPAATALLAGDDALREHEHAVYSAHANALRSYRTRVAGSSATSTEVSKATQPGDLP